MTRTLDGLESVLAVRELSSSPYYCSFSFTTLPINSLSRPNFVNIESFVWSVFLPWNAKHFFSNTTFQKLLFCFCPISSKSIPPLHTGILLTPLTSLLWFSLQFLYFCLSRYWPVQQLFVYSQFACLYKFTSTLLLYLHSCMLSKKELFNYVRTVDGSSYAISVPLCSAYYVHKSVLPTR